MTNKIERMAIVQGGGTAEDDNGDVRVPDDLPDESSEEK